MTLFQDIYQESVAATVAEILGETVTQWPLGVTSDAVAVSNAVWNELDSSDYEGHGKEVRRRGTLFVPDATNIDARDAWIIRDEQWQTVAWDRDQGGNKRVQVASSENERRQSPVRSQGGM
jgi:hypothetical protein